MHLRIEMGYLGQFWCILWILLENWTLFPNTSEGASYIEKWRQQISWNLWGQNTPTLSKNTSFIKAKIYEQLYGSFLRTEYTPGYRPACAWGIFPGSSQLCCSAMQGWEWGGDTEGEGFPRFVQLCVHLFLETNSSVIYQAKVQNKCVVSLA